MIRSLAEVGQPQTREADVLVIGAGIAGLILATRLAAAGKRVVVMESGGERQDGATHPLSEVEQLGTPYAGALLGRARCLGGTSTLWGGAMLPLLAADFGEGAEAWPIDPAQWLRHAGEVERMFGLPPSAYERPDIGGLGADADFVPRLAKWPRFRMRNVATLLGDAVRGARGPEVWLHATATRFTFAPGGRLDSVIASGPTGQSLAVRARETVLAAGAIECTRLLLLADRDGEGRVFAPDNVLGRWFHDHLSAPVAEVVPKDSRAFNRTVGFRFERGGVMRNLRFEPADRAAVRATIAPGFAHIGFEDLPGGFSALRDLFRQLQQRRLPDLPTVAALLGGAPWLARAVWWRLAERRLLAPAGARALLQTVIEQQPRPDSRISLSASRTDPFGLPLAAIDWSVSQADRARLAAFTDSFVACWEGSALAALGEIRRRPLADAEADMCEGGGIYHPCGSTRMGRSAADGVVDADLRTFRVPNLSVAATSVFPRAGGANPTMTLMCAAVQLAERLAA